MTTTVRDETMEQALGAVEAFLASRLGRRSVRVTLDVELQDGEALVAEAEALEDSSLVPHPVYRSGGIENGRPLRS